MPRSKPLSTTASITHVSPADSDTVEIEAPAIGHNGGPPLEGPEIVWGIEGPFGIAAAINRTPAQTRWLIGQGKLRVKKHGHRTVSALRQHLIEDCSGKFQSPNR
jgi:hypothetical protein